MIDSVARKPIHCHTAVWDPSDAHQRGVVLGWLTGYGYLPTVHPSGGLIITHPDGEGVRFALPGEHIVIDIDDRLCEVFADEEFEETFDYLGSVYDPGQGVLDIIAQLFIAPSSGHVVLQRLLFAEQ